MNRLTLRNNRLKFIKTAGELPIIVDEFIEYTPILKKENGKMSTCYWLDLESLGSQPIMPKNLPDHYLEANKENSQICKGRNGSGNHFLKQLNIDLNRVC